MPRAPGRRPRAVRLLLRVLTLQAVCPPALPVRFVAGGIIRFHDLRHTLATLLLGRGVHPKVVSEMLGHADAGITLDLYSHVTATMQHDAARNLDALLGGQVGSAEDEAAGAPS